MELDDWDSSHVVDSFATGTGKYQDARSERLDEEETTSSSAMDDYLLNMSPIGPSPGRSKDWKGPANDVLTVKCTNSRDKITGTPSELALKLCRAMEDYLPQRRRILETGINDQVTEMFEENDESERDAVYEINYKRSESPVAVVGVDEPSENDEESLEYRCPGTMDILSGRMVPCSLAPTLREIALGRRMRRTVVDAPECLPVEDTKLQRRSEIRSGETSDRKRDECCCKKNNNPVSVAKRNTNEFQPTIESCCTRKKKQAAKRSRCVTFDT